MKPYWLLLLPLAALAQWTSTRTTTADWQCQDEAGVKISDHTRQDTAFAACSNLSLADGKTRYVQGGRYRIQASAASSSSSSASTAAVTLSWTAPTQNTDGSQLTDLTGYKVYYGTNPDSLISSISVTGTTATISGLATGATWYFRVSTIATSGEGPKSNAASKAL